MVRFHRCGPGWVIAWGFLLLLLPTIAIVGPLASQASDGVRGQSAHLSGADGCRLAAWVQSAGGCEATGPGTWQGGTLGQPVLDRTGWGNAVSLWSGFWTLSLRLSILTEAKSGPAARDLLYQNYPNPFNPRTTIAYSVAQKSPVQLEIFDVRGRLVRTLCHEEALPGSYRVVWDGKDRTGAPVAAGAYLYRLRIGAFQKIRKMMLIR